MKKLLIAILIFFESQQVFAFGSVVFDPTHTAETVAGWAKQTQDMVAQLNELKQQYQQLQQTYQSISGIRNIGDLLNNPDVMKYLPEDYKTILNSGYAAADSIRDVYKVQGYSLNNPDSESSKAFEKTAMQYATNEALAEEGYRQASQRFDDIQQMLDKINETTDQKSILELQARIQVENAMLQNEANRLAMIGQLAEHQKDLANQAALERQIKSLKSGNHPKNW